MAASLVFTTRRREPVLITPAKATPHEFKPLSDIDDQQGMRLHALVIFFFSGSPSMAGVDPARVVREALAKALVFYYPLAGRLREGPNRKLVVECTGEGALFVEADADVRLEQFGADPQPPFPCLEELIYSCGDLLNSPLLAIQITRLKCGGFIFAMQINHTMADAAGVVQFLKAVAEMARGADSPTVRPVWAREMLMAREPPCVTHEHREYDQLPDESLTAPPGNMLIRSFFFGAKEMSILRQHLPLQLRGSTNFEVLTGFLWRSRITALGIDPDDAEVRVRFIVNARNKCCPPLPAGYYGNAYVFVVAQSKAGELRRNPLAYAVELVRLARASVTDGYLQSVANLMVLRGRPLHTVARTYRVSDVTRMGFDGVDFGWGRALFYGPPMGGGRVIARDRSHYNRFRNSKGEDGILVPVTMPDSAMKRFVKEIERMTKEPNLIDEEPYNASSEAVSTQQKRVGNSIVSRL